MLAMAARRSRHRRWLARSRRFEDARGWRVTHIALNIPLAPRSIRLWRSPDRRFSTLAFSGVGAPNPLIVAGALLALLAVSVVRDAMTGQWASRLPEDLVAITAITAMALWGALWRQASGLAPRKRSGAGQ